jgi:XRE family transcriptional regulator, regulator of sulfur utilization
MHLPRLTLLLALVLPGACAIAASPATPPPPKPKLESSVFDWEKLAVAATATGERRAIVNAPTATLQNFSCHATTLNAGQAAHPPHRHPDEEIVIVKEGTIEVLIEDKRQRAGAGSVFFFAPMDLHGMRNVGDTPATYYVLRAVTAATPKPTAK